MSEGRYYEDFAIEQTFRSKTDLQDHPGRTDHTGTRAENADRLVVQSSPGFWRSQ